MSVMDGMPERDRQRKRIAFELQLEDFIKRYAPADRYDSAQFNTQIMMLVRQVYDDAQAPLLKHMEQIIGLMPPLGSRL